MNIDNLSQRRDKDMNKFHVNYVHVKQWDVITQLCPNFTGFLNTRYGMGIWLHIIYNCGYNHLSMS